MGCTREEDRVRPRCSPGTVAVTVERSAFTSTTGGINMARIIVTTERVSRSQSPALLDERVCSAHLSDNHSAAQLIERLGWAISDAEEAEARLSDRAAVEAAERGVAPERAR
jgi:hypothetical protein